MNGHLRSRVYCLKKWHRICPIQSYSSGNLFVSDDTLEFVRFVGQVHICHAMSLPSRTQLDTTAVENFREYLKIPSVQPNIDYGKSKKSSSTKLIFSQIVINIGLANNNSIIINKYQRQLWLNEVVYVCKSVSSLNKSHYLHWHTRTSFTFVQFILIFMIHPFWNFLFIKLKIPNYYQFNVDAKLLLSVSDASAPPLEILINKFYRNSHIVEWGSISSALSIFNWHGE